jgi:hypothetical protein
VPLKEWTSLSWRSHLHMWFTSCQAVLHLGLGQLHFIVLNFQSPLVVLPYPDWERIFYYELCPLNIYELWTVKYLYSLSTTSDPHPQSNLGYVRTPLNFLILQSGIGCALYNFCFMDRGTLLLSTKWGDYRIMCLLCGMILGKLNVINKVFFVLCKLISHFQITACSRIMAIKIPISLKVVYFLVQRHVNFTKTMFWSCYVAYLLVSFAVSFWISSVINSFNSSEESFTLFTASIFITGARITQSV